MPLISVSNFIYRLANMYIPVHFFIYIFFVLFSFFLFLFLFPSYSPIHMCMCVGACANESVISSFLTVWKHTNIAVWQ